MQPKLITTLKDYSWPAFQGDLFAGITVAMVAIPLSLAIAIASGAPPETGLVTAVVGGLIVSLLGGSRVQIAGPTGAFIVVVYDVIATHGYDGLLLATFMAGVILLVAGYFHAGRLLALVPEAVITGFTLGIAVIIATSQLKDFLGLMPRHNPADFLEKIAALWEARDTLNPGALAIGMLALLLIVGLRAALPRRWPSLIIAVGIASAVAAIPTFGADTIESRFGDLPRGLPAPSFPDFSLARVRELLPSAFVIAFLAGIESLLSAVVADRMIGGAHRHRAELVAQGAANVASPLFGGLPVTGAIARTATNVRSGGRTPVAGIVHSLTVLLVMLFLGPLAGKMAMPAMAAVLLVTAWNMSEPEKWRSYLQQPNHQRFLILLTMLLTVFVDLTVAIGVGVVLGLAIRMQRRHVEAEEFHPRDH